MPNNCILYIVSEIVNFHFDGRSTACVYSTELEVLYWYQANKPEVHLHVVAEPFSFLSPSEILKAMV